MKKEEEEEWSREEEKGGGGRSMAGDSVNGEMDESAKE